MNFQTELAQYKKTLNNYCKDRKEQPEIAARANELLNEMEQANKPAMLSWLVGEGSTLLLMENLRKTSYCGNKGDNSENTLSDFNAFTLLDTVSIYNRRNWAL